MVTTVTPPATLPPPAESCPQPAAREVTREFVRRPAKGWAGSAPIPVVGFDHHCEIRAQR